MYVYILNDRELLKKQWTPNIKNRKNYIFLKFYLLEFLVVCCEKEKKKLLSFYLYSTKKMSIFAYYSNT